MSKPTKVKVGWKDIDIEYVKASFKKDNTDCYGQYLNRENKIEIHEELNPDDLANTLLHEVMHAIVTGKKVVCPDGAMQIYLSEGKGQPGTTFYHPDRSSIRYEIPYKINCGYLMRNHLEQWHGVQRNTTNEKRLSLYMSFQFINQ